MTRRARRWAAAGRHPGGARRCAVLLALAGCVAAGCGGGGGQRHAALTPAPTATATATESATATPAPTPVPRLRHARPCPEDRSLSCAVLRVPLDDSGGTPGTLRLRVATTGPRHAPVVLLLSGGPGEAAIFILPRVRALFPGLARRIRLVTIDQRGTGRGALRCPALQREMGASDLAPPTARAVRACAGAIGPQRQFFSTSDTVADLDALRQALHADRMVLDGVSYGTYVAERYALAHPDAVRGLVLDSVVPHAGVNVFSDTPMQATPRVLHAACPSCPGDPAADLRTEIAAHHDGPQMLDVLTALSISHPHLKIAIDLLHAAAAGHRTGLLRLQRGVERRERSYPANLLSQGLHAGTLCADTPTPWGGPDAPLAGRRAQLDAAVAKLPRAGLGPYDRATASGNGIALQCLYWPPVPAPAPPTGGNLPDAPTLLLSGEQDLSTPLAWARREARTAPHGHLMIVPGAGHSVQLQAIPDVLAAVRRVWLAP
jgi:pimeloyl-ACP methyl ester carboxylesterase